MDKVLSLLGIASRARRIVCGQTVLESFKKNQVKYLFIASDASENTKERYLNKCKYYNVKYCDTYSTSQLSLAIGQNNRKAIGVIDVGLKKKFIEIIDGG